MQLIIIAVSVTVSVAVTFSCVWFKNRFRSKSDKKSNGERNEKADVENSVITTVVSDRTSVNNINQTKTVIETVRNSTCSENDITVSSFDEAINACLKAAESLEHINKSRPKRSNIRRSTRKSKQSLNSDLNEDDKQKKSSSREHVDHEFSSTLSMFSARIEQVTKPLSPTRHVDLNFNRSTESLSGETTPAHKTSVEQIPTLLDRTKRIGSPLLNKAMVEELKRRQMNKLGDQSMANNAKNNNNKANNENKNVDPSVAINNKENKNDSSIDNNVNDNDDDVPKIDT